MNCPQKKSKKGSSKGSDGDALSSQFELDFSLITYMVSSMVGCVWYLDSGASFHMSGENNLFNTLEEKDLQTMSQVKVQLCFRGSMVLLSPYLLSSMY